MIEVTLKYGLTREITREVENGITIGELLADPNNRAVLGYGENVVAVIDGQTVSRTDGVVDGDTIVIEQQAASKAA